MPFARQSKLSEPQAMVLVALIGVVTTVISGFVTWQVSRPTNKEVKRAVALTDAEKRLDDALRAPSGKQKKIYPKLGFGFIAPSAWIVEDYAAKFGVSDIDVVQRYTAQKAAIGVEFKLMPVQPNYVNDIQAEVRNQADVWKKDDPNLQISETTVSGFPAKQFDFTKATGERRGKIRAYWVRIVPEVKLQIFCFTYTDEPDREAFWSEAERLVESTVVDRELLEQRRNSNDG